MLAIEFMGDFTMKNQNITIFNYTCSRDDCDLIKTSLKAEFAKKVMPFEDGQFWDQPSSYRLLNGLLTTFHRYSEQYAGSFFVDLYYRTKNANLFLNCKETEVQEVLKNPVAPDMFEFGGS